MNNLKDQYDKVCFSLNNANAELSKLCLENFIFNPKIKEVTERIKELNIEKINLENKLAEEEKNA